MRAERYAGWGAFENSFLDEFEIPLEKEYFFLPFSDFRRWIPEGDKWFEIQHSFPLWRLRGIRQLSFLSYTGPNKETSIIEYPHTRFLHSQQVAVISQEIVRGNGGTPEQQLFVKVVAGLHDIATPAHGDATKKVDPKSLNEEDHWKTMVKEDGVKFLDENGILIDDVDKAIHNKGIYGKILDVADRIAYVFQDTSAILNPNYLDYEIDEYTSVVRAILGGDHKLGNIYQDVLIDWKKQEVIFSDIERLSKFLLLRSHMHVAHYMHPTSLGRDLLVAKLIKPFYSPDEEDVKNGLLTPGTLREKNDEWLINYLSSKYGRDLSDIFFRYLIDWKPDFEKFNGEDEAKEAEIRRKEEGKKVIGIYKSKGFDTGNDYLFLNGRRYETFRNLGYGSLQLTRHSDRVKGTYIIFAPDDNGFITHLVEESQRFQKEREGKS